MSESVPVAAVASIARDAAFEAQVPWRLQELRVAALGAARTTSERVARSGFSSEQIEKLMVRAAREAVRNAARGMETLPPGAERPTPEQIDAALGAFDVKQWRTLIGDMDWANVEALRSHLAENLDEIKRRLGSRKEERVEASATVRSTELWLEENRWRLEPITDPYWADFWSKQARAMNREGRGQTANGRSVAEAASSRSIARRLTKRDEQIGRDLKVSPYEVKKWRERHERYPFEQYLADRDVGDDPGAWGAAFIDYWAMIRKKHQRDN